MSVIRGNTTATPMKRPDMAQTDPKKSDYIKNNPLAGVTEADDGKVLSVKDGIPTFINTNELVGVPIGDAVVQAKSYTDDEISKAKADVTSEINGTIALVQEQLNHTALVAEGAAKALAYPCYSDMVTALQGDLELHTGQHILIQTLEVPDLWVYEVASSYSAFTYVSDESIVESLKQEPIQVGYYKLSALETQKVDLSQYSTIEYANKIKQAAEAVGDEVKTLKGRKLYHHLVSFDFSYSDAPSEPISYGGCVSVEIIDNNPNPYLTEQALTELNSVGNLASGHFIWSSAISSDQGLEEILINSVDFSDNYIIFNCCRFDNSKHISPYTFVLQQQFSYSIRNITDSVREISGIHGGEGSEGSEGDTTAPNHTLQDAKNYTDAEVAKLREELSQIPLVTLYTLEFGKPIVVGEINEFKFIAFNRTPVVGERFFAYCIEKATQKSFHISAVITEIKEATETTDATAVFKIEEAIQCGGANLPTYWEEHLTEKIATIKALQEGGGKDCFSFIVITDMHYSENLGKKSPLLAKKIADECGIKYCLCLGDMQTRHGALHDAEDIEGEWKDIEKMLSPIRDRLLITQGNHDGSYGWFDLNNDGYINDDVNGDGVADSYDKDVHNYTPQKLYERIFRKVSTIDGVHFSEDGKGYYVDDTASKVRYILLNSHTNKWELNEDGSIKYNNMYNFRFGQAQYDMVIEALGSLEKGWSVIVASHVPLDRTGEMKAWGKTDSTDAECCLMADVLNAFVNRDPVAKSFRGTQSNGKGYTNLADTTSEDWKVGYGIAEDGSLDGGGKYQSVVTNYIRANPRDVIYFKNFTYYATNARIAYYDENKVLLSPRVGWQSPITYGSFTTDEATGISKYVFASNDGENIIDSLANAAYARFELTIPNGEPIITVNEPIVESAEFFDSVSVNADFSEANGTLIGYFGGHVHKDKQWDSAYSYGGAKQCDFWTIATRCDSHNENDRYNSDKTENYDGDWWEKNGVVGTVNGGVGTVKEQSFDVFTVNKSTRTIHATKIGAGTDREISY